MTTGKRSKPSEFAELAFTACRPPEAFSCRLVKAWIWLSALASLAGWTLSAAGQLNRMGYAIFLIVAAVIIFLIYRHGSVRPAGGNVPTRKKFLRRFCRPLPCAFAALAFLVFLGGLIYPPSNYTGLAYRVARVLQWLDHGQWWWIHTPDYRMNDRACGIEWIYTPLLLFTKSVRALFLVNFIPFLLMPGLIFSVFTRLGVRPRVAWPWMWLLPMGYNFLLQAGSIANDAFPTVYALAALDFVLRAASSRRLSDLWYAIVAAALLTGAKAGNLPLLLPCAIVGCTLLPLLKRRVVATVSVFLLGIVISFAPIAMFNTIYAGDWSGANLEVAHMTTQNPWTGIWGNAFQLALDNFAPPVMPLAGWWNAHVQSILPGFIVRAAREDFEGDIIILGELPTEDWAGIGLGLSALLTISVASALRIRQRQLPVKTAGTISDPLRRCVLIAGWVALLAYCVESGMSNAARIIAPYYPFLVASLITGAAQSEIVRRRWWRMLAGLTVILSFVVLVLSPDRPLWPARTILSHWSVQHPGQEMVGRALKVYNLYAQRPDGLAAVRAMLPSEIKTIGYVGGVDDNDFSLWLPLGTRRVEHFLVADPPSLLRSRVQYVVVGGFNLGEQHTTIDAWLRTNNAEIVATTNAVVKLSEGEQLWYLTRLKP